MTAVRSIGMQSPAHDPFVRSIAPCPLPSGPASGQQDGFCR